MITHRLNLNTYVDQIIYLGKNGYFESGTHQELTQNKDGRYYKLWEDFTAEQ